MSAQKTILVTGATGNQGRGVVRHCLAHGHAVLALVRDPSAPAALELQRSGAELRVGTFDDVSSLRAAMRGADAVFATEVRTREGNAADLGRLGNVVDAALAAEPPVGLFVVSTAYKTGEHESFAGWGPQHPMYSYWLQKEAIEKLVRNAGFEHWLALRPAHFLQNLKVPLSNWCFTGLAEKDAETGKRIISTAWKPETKVVYLDVEDVGVPTSLAVSEPAKYHGRTIDMGAEAVTIAQMAEKLGRVLGEGEGAVGVRYMTDEEADAALAAGGNPAIASQKWANTLGEQSVTTEFPMTSIEDFVARNKGEIFPGLDGENGSAQKPDLVGYDK
ncbi:hypothetical protein N3K66_005183 [Trichothecium roseum]|uniref:Uncharacterized protein n=1 Tax=Trichothecium roseum TaxID=47278 RepID=A0ACC0V611_9HYPO|nr:hypothetical protein N3K66_005183 [Trichothecium roseum]